MNIFDTISNHQISDFQTTKTKCKLFASKSRAVNLIKIQLFYPKKKNKILEMKIFMFNESKSLFFMIITHIYLFIHF